MRRAAINHQAASRSGIALQAGLQANARAACGGMQAKAAKPDAAPVEATATAWLGHASTKGKVSMFLNLSRQSGPAHGLRSLLLLAALVPLSACQSAPPSPYIWKEFVSTRGHANPIPAQWVATPEGKFAHELVIPNPVPADSGYKSGMSAGEYYRHLCDTEAGDFIFKTVDNVEGVYFARPPKSPSDQDLMDRWKLEHPRFESTFQLRERPEERAVRFIDPPLATYQFYEEPNLDPKASQPYWRLSGYKSSNDFRYDENGKWGRIPATPWKQEPISQLKARYGLTWRGIHRPHDRDNGIAGGEIIAYDIQTNEVLAVFRNYAFSGRTKNTPDGVWWLSAGGCYQLFRGLDGTDAGLRSRPKTVLIPAK